MKRRKKRGCGGGVRTKAIMGSNVRARGAGKNPRIVGVWCEADEEPPSLPRLGRRIGRQPLLEEAEVRNRRQVVVPCIEGREGEDRRTPPRLRRRPSVVLPSLLVGLVRGRSFACDRGAGGGPAVDPYRRGVARVHVYSLQDPWWPERLGGGLVVPLPTSTP